MIPLLPSWKLLKKKEKKSVKSSLPIRLLIWAFRKKKSSQRWTMMSMS